MGNRRAAGTGRPSGPTTRTVVRRGRQLELHGPHGRQGRSREYLPENPLVRVVGPDRERKARAIGSFLDRDVDPKPALRIRLRPRAPVLAGRGRAIRKQRSRRPRRAGPGNPGPGPRPSPRPPHCATITITSAASVIGSPLNSGAGRSGCQRFAVHRRQPGPLDNSPGAEHTTIVVGVHVIRLSDGCHEPWTIRDPRIAAGSIRFPLGESETAANGY